MFCVAKRSILRIRFLSKTHLVGDFPSKLKREVLNTKLSREASLKKKKVADVKTKLSCQTSFKN
jgi:hypothetical protein